MGVVERPRDIISFLNNLKSLGKQVYRKDALKMEQEKLSKSLFNIRFKEKVRKTTCSEIEKPD